MGKVSIQAPSLDFQLASIGTADSVIYFSCLCDFHTQNCTTCSSEMLQEAQGQEDRPITRDDGCFEGDAASAPTDPPLLIHPSRRSIFNSFHERRLKTYFDTILTKYRFCFAAKNVVRLSQLIVSRILLPFPKGNATKLVGGLPLPFKANLRPPLSRQLSMREGLEWGTLSRVKPRAGPMVTLHGWMAYVSSPSTYLWCSQALRLVQERLSTNAWLHQAMRARPQRTGPGLFAVRPQPRRGSTCFQLMVSLPFLGCGWLFGLTGTWTFFS